MTNVTNSMLAEWEVELDLNSASIINNWGAELSKKNKSILFTPAHWFSAIEPDDSFEFGYCANKDANEKNWQPKLIFHPTVDS